MRALFGAWTRSTSWWRASAAGTLRRTADSPMTVTCVDWRTSDQGQIAPLYDAEIGRWSSGLGWDTRAVWKEVDRGRRLGTVLGRLALEGTGACAGWTFAVVHRGVLQIGGLVAKSQEVGSALLQ